MRRTSLIVLAISIVALSFAFASPAYADDIHISSCSELQSIGSGTGNNSFILDNNINCNGTSFNPILFAGDTPLSGEFNGNGHIIFDLGIVSGSNHVGLFKNLSGANVHDLTFINSSVTGVQDVGTVAGYAINSTVTNVHVNGNVNGSDLATGGLIGEAKNSSLEYVSMNGDVSGAAQVGGIIGWQYAEFGDTSSLKRAWSTANVTAGGIGYAIGGLVGQVASYGGGLATDSSDAEIVDSFATGNVTAASSSTVGGLIGQIFGRYGTSDAPTNITVNRAYATGNVTGNEQVSGLVGYAGIASQYDSVSVNNSFTVSEVDADGSNGAIIADVETETEEDFVTAVNNVFDADTYFGDCVGNADYSATCSSYDGNGPFLGNTDNAPINGVWEFDNPGPWYIYENSYPRLTPDNDFDGISASEEESCNDGDGNADFVPDFLQYNVANFATIGNKCANISVTNGILTDLAPGALSNNESFEFPFGVYGFSIQLDAGENSADVEVLIYTDELAEEFEAKKFNTDTEQLTDVEGATISDQTIFSDHAVLIQYSATDGGDNDQDGVENGTIIDPVGLAQAIVPQASTTSTTQVIPAQSSASGNLPITGSTFKLILEAAAMLVAIGISVSIIFKRKTLFN